MPVQSIITPEKFFRSFGVHMAKIPVLTSWRYECWDEFEGLRTRFLENTPNELYVRLLAWRQAKVRERALHKCENCYQHLPIQVHHKMHRSAGGNHAYVNLVALCEKCHKGTHDMSGLHRQLKHASLSMSAQERIENEEEHQS